MSSSSALCRRGSTSRLRRIRRSAEEARRSGGDRLPLARQAVEPRRLPRRFRRQAFRCESVCGARPRLRRRGALRADGAGADSGGDDELYTVGSYIAADGTVLGLFCGRKLRQSPPGVGTCRVGEALWVDEVVDAALRLLRAFDFHGISQVEFKRDPRDGRFKLMEINPRLWQWHGLAAALGVDFPRIAYLDLLRRRRAAVTTEGSTDAGRSRCSQASHLLSSSRRTSIHCSPSTIRSPAFAISPASPRPPLR